MCHRFWHNSGRKGWKDIGLPMLAYWIFSYKVYVAGWNVGVLRFSKEDFYESGKKDMRALDTLIGKKKFVFSDEKPSDIDFVIFGLCAQIKYTDKGAFNRFMLSKLDFILKKVYCWKFSV